MDEQDKCEQCDARGQHTPEPWRLVTHADGMYITALHNRVTIAKVYCTFDEQQKNQKADALLMCAAPTLLAACEEVLYRLEPGELAAILAAAILKAKPL